jgi:hypothetical protein
MDDRLSNHLEVVDPTEEVEVVVAADSGGDNP